jgi:hypothetical protein
MKHSVLLTITSLISILLTTFHLTDDYVRGLSRGDLSSLPVVFVLAAWMYGTLVLLERRSGHVIVLIASLLASALPVIHMLGRAGLTAGIKSSGGFFFAWTLIALGVTANFSAILSACGLWSLRRNRPT